MDAVQSDSAIREGGANVTKAEKELLRNIDPRMQDQFVMVCRIEKALRKKCKQILPTFEDMPVAQAVTTTQGEQVLKNNPAMQEIRATLRDYISTVKTQWDMIGDDKAPTEVTAIDSIRQRLRIAK